MRITVPIRLRWSDIDAYAHVNNAAMLGLLEEVRIQAFWAAADSADDAAGDGGGPAILDGRPGADTLSLIAHQEIEYLRPIPYGRQPLDCEVWIARLGGASLDVHYEVYSPAGVEPRELTTRAASTLVLVDAATQKPRRVSEAERAAWSPYLEEPVRFTARR
ncbi:acyl-CoA thioesterase [Amnibacterium kyonggiense]|uniref:Acyl-CoA thioester hydrolase n=1 Tax=Amnibacterium kyonggiense TaxID=595671 RepID=A0A4R7FT71_9MICO|nr:thioesterase family protein [Amnibacterium kyonggiense]TDS81095.1 acyl-CoA thioester hydrolase [Amnibacterium kyonggiense]